MSSTTAVVSNFNHHFQKQVSQEFSHIEHQNSSQPCIPSHPETDAGHPPCPLHLSRQPTQNQCGTSSSSLGASARLVSSNIDSALRNSLKPWLSTAGTCNQTDSSIGFTNSMDFTLRSLTFHESLAPPLDVVIRQRIENHPNSLILSDAVTPDKHRAAKDVLCTDSELAFLCRSGGDHVPSQSLGLSNSGNTCYLNSVLQCILATGPLLAYASTKHSNSDSCPTTSGQLGPNKSRFCALCGLVRLVREHSHRSQPANVRVPSCGFGHILPSYFLANVRAVCPGFRPYQQEDAHEFLLGLLSRMEDNTMAGLGKIPRSLSETNAIRRIFGGTVRSEVTCHTCHNVSARDEISFNLSVDITCGRSLQQCLFNYIHSEELCGQNAYKCEKCRQYRSATRRSTILQGGPILIIQFNRFSRNQKLDTRVEFPSSFNLRPFMTDNKGPPILYRLYGTVNHEGYSCRSGHYIAFTRRHGLWLSHNDCFVNSTNVEQVLRQTPYLLFYEAVNPIQTTPETTAGSIQKDQTTSLVADKPTKQPPNATSAAGIDDSSVKPVTLSTTALTASDAVQTVPKPVCGNGQISGISTPRIVFNPNVKQRPSLNTVAQTTCLASTTTSMSTDSFSQIVTKSTNLTVTPTSSCIATTTTPVTDSVDSSGKNSTKPSLGTFSSATVRQLLYGETPTPGLWSERSTPPVSVSASSSLNQLQVRMNGKSESPADHNSPRKRKHSPSLPSPEVQNDSGSGSVLSESSDSHGEPTARNKRINLCEVPTPTKQPRRVSESSSDSSIVWVPKGSSTSRLHEHLALLSHLTNGVNEDSGSSRDRSHIRSVVDRSDRKHRHRHHRHHHHKKRKHRLDDANLYHNGCDKHHYHTPHSHRKEHRNGDRKFSRSNHQNAKQYTVFHRPHNLSRPN